MRQIPLTQNKVALVDDQDFDFLNQWNWCVSRGRRTFYVMRSITRNGKTQKISMHRLILDAPNSMQVDHIDHDGLNNTRYNIRLCTGAQNHHNQKKHKRTTSMYKGVCWDKGHKKWAASIQRNRLSFFLGYFSVEEEAARAYNWAAAKYFGAFAKLNRVLLKL